MDDIPDEPSVEAVNGDTEGMDVDTEEINNMLEFDNGRYVPRQDGFHIQTITMTGTRSRDPPYFISIWFTLFVHSLVIRFSYCI